jgi:hypothetical protein
VIGQPPPPHQRCPADQPAVDHRVTVCPRTDRCPALV